MRTDTMILVSIHDATGRTALVSIPRNLTRLRFPPGTPKSAARVGEIATRPPTGPVTVGLPPGLSRVQYLRVIERIGPRLVRHLPRPNITILVRRDPEAVRRDRPDALADRNHERRRELYDRLAAFFGLAIIDNDGTPDQSVAEILRLAGLGGGSSSRGKVRDLRFLQQ